jgi:hypothetical protein
MSAHNGEQMFFGNTKFLIWKCNQDNRQQLHG